MIYKCVETFLLEKLESHLKDHFHYIFPYSYFGSGHCVDLWCELKQLSLYSNIKPIKHFTEGLLQIA